ncbi:MAG: DUF2971 domain-containing protein [Ilumatobacter fluminis]|uniref:DUF2971 domain-containing protein n=1 Tax=Ilumatobacter fluminis TaxID=467091 RepID=UPI0032EB0D17
MDMFEWRSARPFGIETELNPDDLVFHYTTIERAAAIGLTGRILLGPLATLNDPQESEVRRLIASTSDMFAPDLDERTAAFQIELATLRSEIRVACFTRDAMLGASGTVERADGRGFARSAMWAHYGDGHEGACIALDRGQLEQLANKLSPDARCAPVSYAAGLNLDVYRAEYVDIDHPDLATQHGAVLDSLFTKNSDWSPEREYRIVIDSWTDPVCAIEVLGAVRGLAFGNSLKPHQIPLVESLRKAFDLNYSEVALMMHQNGLLTAVPIYDSDGVPHRWTSDELSSGAVYDLAAPDS